MLPSYTLVAVQPIIAAGSAAHRYGCPVDGLRYCERCGYAEAAVKDRACSGVPGQLGPLADTRPAHEAPSAYVVDVCMTCGRLAKWPFCEHRDKAPRPWTMPLVVKPSPAQRRHLQEAMNERAGGA